MGQDTIYEIPLSFKIKGEYLRAIAEGNGFMTDPGAPPEQAPSDSDYLAFIREVVAPQALLAVSSPYVLEEVKRKTGLEDAAKQVLEQERAVSQSVSELALEAITVGQEKVV